jgi:hypothetical protein
MPPSAAATNERSPDFVNTVAALPLYFISPNKQCQRYRNEAKQSFDHGIFLNRSETNLAFTKILKDRRRSEANSDYSITKKDQSEATSAYSIF